MSFTTRASTAVYSTMSPGVWETFAQDPQPVANGFDVLNVIFMADFRATVKTALEIIALFPQGMRFGTQDFWLRDARPSCVGGNVWRVEARFEGRISLAKPVHVALLSGTGTDTISIPGPSSGTTTFWNAWLPFPVTLGSGQSILLSIREGTPGFEFSYMQIGGPLRTHLVGLGELSGSPRVSPPIRPAVRNSPWSDFTSNNWRLNIPAGYVFEDLRNDEIVGADVHWVTELWNYMPLFKPQN